MNKIIVMLSAALLIQGCTQPEDASRVLRQAGYTDIKMIGYSVFGCANDDLQHDKFTAKTPSGETVEGVVCAGIFKGSTIRVY